jgi:hypothetical protein
MKTGFKCNLKINRLEGGETDMIVNKENLKMPSINIA